jgi:hypothetical protein
MLVITVLRMCSELIVKTAVLWDVTPFLSAKTYHRSRRALCLHLEDGTMNMATVLHRNFCNLCLITRHQVSENSRLCFYFNL